MDETGMSYADKVEFVDDVLRTWGEEAAQEVAERYAVDLRTGHGRSCFGREPAVNRPPP
jgi:hypothetical protein